MCVEGKQIVRWTLTLPLSSTQIVRHMNCTSFHLNNVAAAGKPIQTSTMNIQKEKELNILKPFLTAALSQIAKESYAMVAHLVISG
jgi:hypothetical protein